MIFKACKKSGGIYAIVNTIDGKMYVGKTKNFYIRFKQHECDIQKRRNNINDFLMSAIEKDGYKNFNFISLEICSKEELFYKELFWIEKLKTTELEFGYNLRKDTDVGMLTHDSTSKKISNRLKKEWKEGKRNDHSKKLKNNWEKNPERREAQSKIFSKTKTKYKYIVSQNGVEKILNYKGLNELGLKDVVSYFHRKKSDDVICKGFRVVRKKADD